MKIIQMLVLGIFLQSCVLVLPSTRLVQEDLDFVEEQDLDLVDNIQIYLIPKADPWFDLFGA